MKKGRGGGESTRTGLEFEKRTSLKTLFQAIPGYDVKDTEGKAGFYLRYKGRVVGRLFPKYEFYRFLGEEGVNWKDVVSKRLVPDDALLVIVRDTLFIIEVKYQQVGGSVDEKLQTCDFKRKQYVKLTRELGLRVEYVYVLSDWFKDPRYKDTLDYILSVNCHYMFNSIPLKWFGLPDPE